MSIQYMSKVWKLEELDPNTKFVFLALCDNANDEGICYPSIEKLVIKTSLSKPTVIKNIAKLIEFKLLMKYQRATKRGGRYSSVYLVFPSETLENLDSEYLQKFSQSKQALPIEKTSQSKTVLPENDSQSKTVLPEPSLTLFNHHLFIDMNSTEKDLYLEYTALRKKMKLITTMSTHNSLLKKYFEFGRDIQIIQRAIDSNWKDFYPIQNKQQFQPRQSKMDVTMDTWERAQILKQNIANGGNYIDGEIVE